MRADQAKTGSWQSSAEIQSGESLASSFFFLLSLFKEDDLKWKEAQKGSNRMILKGTCSMKPSSENLHK